MPLIRSSLLASLLTAVVLSAAAPAHAAEPILVIDGQGWGHGVGMAQDGAFWMGRAGASTEQILGHFYPGVSEGRASGAVRVPVLDAGRGEAALTFPNGGEVRSPRDGAQRPGFPIAVPAGGIVRVRHDGEYRVLAPSPAATQAIRAQVILPLPTSSTTSTTLVRPPTPTTTTTTAPPRTTTSSTPPTTAPPDTTTTTAPEGPTVERRSPDSIWARPAIEGTIGVPARNARYRGDVEASWGGGALRLVNELDVEQYLRGMGEVRDPTWPAASLRAQAIAARTYALRAMRAAGEICDTQRCQVYLGQQAEYGAMDVAVAETAGRVLVFGGGLAAAVYSANGAGVSATPNEGFGTPDESYPYLRASPYETRSPAPWTSRIAVRDLATRLRYPGDITAVSVAATGPSGRPLTVAVTGSAGERTVSATDLADKLSLRSTKWEVRVELGEAPPPPPEGEGVQLLPDELPTRARPARSVVHPTVDTGYPAAVLAVLALLAAVNTGGAVAVETAPAWQARRAARVFRRELGPPRSR
jgi:stage II sporulation protein D